LFATLGPLVSALAIVVKGAMASQVAIWPGYVMAIIPIWLTFSLAFSLPTGLLAILGGGWLAAFSGPRVKNLFTYLGLCATSAGLLSLAGSGLYLSERLLGSSFVPRPEASVMALSWMLAGAGCGYLLRRTDTGFRPEIDGEPSPA
jgi:hypothetical protein